MKDKEFLLEHLEKIATDLEEIVNYLLPAQSAIYVDSEQHLNFISVEDALVVLDSFGNNSASEMIGKTEYILIYDASKKLVLNGDAYVPSGYIVMKSCQGLHGLNESDVNAILPELKSRICELVFGQYRIQTYKLG